MCLLSDNRFFWIIQGSEAFESLVYHQRRRLIELGGLVGRVGLTREFDRSGLVVLTQAPKPGGREGSNLDPGSVFGLE